MEISAGTRAVGGVVLSAGRSARMGEPKALLEVDGRTFLEAAAEALLEGGCREVVVVAGATDRGVADAARQLPLTLTRAPAGSEQIDSVRTGLDALSPDLLAAVVLPVDHPLVSATTVAALIDASRSDPEAIIRPTRNGRPGHPTLFPRTVWPRLDDPALPRGARSVVESPDTRTVNVPVDDAGILADIDTPGDYRRWVAGRSDPAP